MLNSGGPSNTTEQPRGKLLPAALMLAATFFPSRAAVADQTPVAGPAIPAAAAPLVPVAAPAAVEDLRTATLPAAPAADSSPAITAQAAPEKQDAKGSAPEAPSSKSSEPPHHEFVRWDDLLGYLKTGVLGLTVAAFAILGSLSGTASGIERIRGGLAARRRFKNNEFFDHLPCNVISLDHEGDKIKLTVTPISNCRVSEFIPNAYALRRFLDAAHGCSDERPFPSLNYPRKEAPQKKGFLSGMFNPADPDKQRIDGLNRTNKYILDSFCSQYKDGALAHAADLPTKREKFVLMPMCDVYPIAGSKENKTGKALLLGAITESDFEIFKDPEVVAKIYPGLPQHRDLIRVLSPANAEDAAYNSIAQQEVVHEQLFPRAIVPLRV